MPNTFTLIASSTVGSGGAASITFSSIPQTYTDLVVKYSLRGDLASTLTYVQVELNGLSTNRSSKLLGGNGSSAFSVDYTSDIYTIGTGTNATASTFGNGEIYFPNYTSSNNKSMSIDSMTENNATAASIYVFAGLWSSSNAITQIGLFAADSGLAKNKNFVQYSSAYLYGIKKD